MTPQSVSRSHGSRFSRFICLRSCYSFSRRSRRKYRDRRDKVAPFAPQCTGVFARFECARRSSSRRRRRRVANFAQRCPRKRELRAKPRQGLMGHSILLEPDNRDNRITGRRETPHPDKFAASRATGLSRALSSTCYLPSLSPPSYPLVFPRAV